MIIVEGPRNTGKTFLIENTTQGRIVYKFPFAPIFNYFEMDINVGRGFAMGKDLQFLSIYTSKLLPRSIISDRGFFSTAVYGVLDKRITESQAIEYLDFISSHFDMRYIKIVFVSGRNPNSEQVRAKKDGWEDLTYEKQFDMYIRLAKYIQVDIIYFENKFDQRSMDIFREIITREE